MKKRVLFVIGVLLLMSILATSSFAENGVTVTLNGEVIDCASYGQEAEIVNGRTMVPLRAIFESLGASVEWEQSTKTVTSTRGETTIRLTIGENKLYRNSECIEIDVPAQIMNGRTMVPARAVAESFGVVVEWDGDNRVVVLNMEVMKKVDETGKIVYVDWIHACGDFYFGMTKEEVLDKLTPFSASEFDNEISVSFSDECDEVKSSIIDDVFIEDMDFGFKDGILRKIVLFTDYGSRSKCMGELEKLTAYYGEPTEKNRGDEEFVWMIEGQDIEVSATLYCVESKLFADPNSGYYVEIQIKYTGNAFDMPEENKEESIPESEETEYIYGKYYFGMKSDEVLDVSGRTKDNKQVSVRKDSEEDSVSYITLNDVNAEYEDEDESITGKANVKRIEFEFKKDQLCDIYLETGYVMTREEAYAVLDSLKARYKEPSIIIADPENYEWISDEIQINLYIDENTKEDGEKVFGVELRYTKGGFKKDLKFNLLDQIPLGLELQMVMKAFDARCERGENRIEFFEIYDPGIHELRSYTTMNPVGDEVRFNVVKESYIPEKDIFGQGFRCYYISLDFVDGVYDNCFVKTSASDKIGAVETMKYVAKYFGVEKAVFDKENIRYEWKDYNFRGKNGISKVNIYSGIVEQENSRYYCYVSVQIADSVRYSYIDEEGRIAGHDYPHAYGNLYFGMTFEQAAAVIKSEKETNRNAFRIYVTDNESAFDDEDENITGKLNFEEMEILFDTTTKSLCGVRASGVNISDEQAHMALETLCAYYGETDEEKTHPEGRSYSWVLRGKNTLVNFEVIKDENGEDLYVCTYSIILVGSNLADV